jgi:hypothetical protein
VVGNPPYAGSTQTSAANGVAYRDYLVVRLAGGERGKADLAAFFLLRAASFASYLGLLTTNSIAQTSSRDVGLGRLESAGWTIARCATSASWPGGASVEVVEIWMSALPWTGDRWIDEVRAPLITPLLSPGRSVTGTPRPLGANRGRAAIGTKPRGEGFLLTAEEAEELIRAEPSTADAIKPFLSAHDLNSSPTQFASRYVIDVGDVSEAEARSRFPVLMERLEDRVKPERLKIPSAALRDRWWVHEHRAEPLYRQLAGRSRALVIAEVSKTVQPAWASTGQVFSSMLVIFTLESHIDFGVLSSAFHRWWALTFASSMRSDLRYTPSKVFDTFPRPMPQDPTVGAALARAGEALDQVRSELMVRTNLGLTKTYNRVHDPEENDQGVVRLRELHVELDHAIRAAYGWSDLEFDHHHWETPQGMRFTVSPAAKDELLDRLLELNHERYAAEVAAGLHDKKAKRSSGRKRASKAAGGGQGSLL